MQQIVAVDRAATLGIRGASHPLGLPQGGWEESTMEGVLVHLLWVGDEVGRLLRV